MDNIKAWDSGDHQKSPLSKRCKAHKSQMKLAKLISFAIKHKQRVWYSERYDEWLTQQYTTRTNYILMFDFRKSKI